MRNFYKKKQILLPSVIMLSLLMVLGFNSFLMPGDVSSFLGFFSGDISSKSSVDMGKFIKIFLVMTLETGMLSVIFYYVTKKVL